MPGPSFWLNTIVVGWGQRSRNVGVKGRSSRYVHNGIRTKYCTRGGEPELGKLINQEPEQARYPVTDYNGHVVHVPFSYRRVASGRLSI